MNNSKLGCWNISPRIRIRNGGVAFVRTMDVRDCRACLARCRTSNAAARDHRGSLTSVSNSYRTSRSRRRIDIRIDTTNPEIDVRRVGGARSGGPAGD